MRGTMILLILVMAALLGRPTISTAQNAVSQYPWCLQRAAGPRSCYYASYEQCRDEALSRGGFCIQSPYYHGPAAGAAVRPRHRRHS
jgi:hypothetical protein